MPTIPKFAELQAAYPDKSPEEIVAAWDKKYPGYALPGAPAAPSLWDKIKGVATSKPVMMGAAGLLAAPLTGGMSIPATMAAEAGVAGLSGLASDALNGKTDTPGEFATDAALGAAGPVLGRGLSAAGRGLAYVGESLPRSIRSLVGFGGLAMGHPGALALEGATNPRLLPKALTKVGDAYTAGVERLRGSAGNPLMQGEATAVKGSIPKNYRGVSSETPYRMNFEPVTEAQNPTRAGVKALVDETKAGTAAANAKRMRLDPTNVINDVIGSGPNMDRMYAQANPGFRDMQLKGTFGERGFNEAVDALNKPMDVQPVNYGRAPLAPGSQNIGMEEVDAFLNKLGLGGGNKMAPVASHAAESAAPVAQAAESGMGRPAGDYIHPADTTGGKFGFDSLPPLSESELSRLQALFNRVGAR